MGQLKRIFASFFMLAFCQGMLNMAQAQSLAKQRTVNIDGKQYLLTSKLKAIVLGNFTYGFNHTVGAPNLDSTISRIGKSEGWIVDRITTGSNVTAANLAKYQVFFANYISGFGGGRNGGLSAAGMLALQDFVETKGGGLFLQHSSGDSPNNSTWPWFANFVHPCHYAGEASRDQNSTGWIGIYHAAAKAHPIMEGIAWTGGARGPDSVIVPNMELHSFDKAITNSAITPANWQGLLGLNPATCGIANKCDAGNYDYASAGGPLGWATSWTFPLKKGNIGYFMEGHDLTTMTAMTKPVWDRFYKQFLYYIAGYDTTIVTTLFKSSHPKMEFALDASGITFHPLSEPGVLVNKTGYHIVTLFDVAGHKIRQERGKVSPIDYDFSADLRGKHGVYFMRVNVAGATFSKRFILR